MTYSEDVPGIVKAWDVRKLQDEKPLWELVAAEGPFDPRRDGKSLAHVRLPACDVYLVVMSRCWPEGAS